MQKRYPQFRTTEGSPRLYYWETKIDQDEITAVDELNDYIIAASEESSIKEPDLCPKLSNYLRSEHGIYSLHIDERKSSNTKGPKGNSWLHPDIVGLENPQVKWETEVRDTAKKHLGKRVKIWSFEVKKRLAQNNVRQAFFQAVSNSSWANFGYLVVKTIEKDGSLEELRMLASLHGIGLIDLNFDNPAESQIMIPARERSDVDWTTCNRLTKENKDFRQFMVLILRDDPHSRDWYSAT